MKDYALNYALSDADQAKKPVTVNLEPYRLRVDYKTLRFVDNLARIPGSTCIWINRHLFVKSIHSFHKCDLWFFDLPSSVVFYIVKNRSSLGSSFTQSMKMLESEFSKPVLIRQDHDLLTYSYRLKETLCAFIAFEYQKRLSSN